MRKMSHTTILIPDAVIDGVLLKLPLKSIFRFKCVSRPWHDLICDFSDSRFHLQLVQFLLKLPPKSLVRFKCVCSSWNDLISHPSFARAHLQHNRHNISIVSLERDETMAVSHKNSTCDKLVLKEFIPIPRLDHGAMLICSCDGILCYSTLQEQNGEIELVLWNPSIRKHKILKVPKRKSREKNTFAIRYDSSIDDYKLIRISEWTNHRKMPTDNMIVEVMAMKSNHWRRVSDDPPYNPDSRFHHNLATVVSQHGSVYLLHRIDQIIRFDLATETFNQVPSPPNCKSFSLDCTRMLEVDDKMYLTTYSRARNFTSIWIMKDGTWVRFFCRTLNVDVNHEKSQLVFVEGGAFLQTIYRSIYIHGLKDKANRQAQPLQNFECHLLNAFECVNSLVSP